MGRVLVGGQRQHARLRILRHQPAHGLDAAHAGHRQIHHDDVGPGTRVELASLLAVARLGDDLQLRVGQQHAKTHAHERVVVDQHDTDHAASADSRKGIRTVSRTPCGSIA